MGDLQVYCANCCGITLCAPVIELLSDVDVEVNECAHLEPERVNSGEIASRINALEAAVGVAEKNDINEIWHVAFGAGVLVLDHGGTP